VPLLFGILVSALIIFAIFAVAIGYGGSMTQFRPDWPGRPLPEDRTVRAHDVADAQFSLAFRGYRMAEVDEALDRLAVEIAERDEQIERLTGQPFEYAPPTPPATPDVDAYDSIASEPADPIDAGTVVPEPIDAGPAVPEPVDAGPVDAGSVVRGPIDASTAVPEPVDAGMVVPEPIVAEHRVDGGGPATQPIPPVVEPGVER
jgi:DivIVA domain-containing protein